MKKKILLSLIASLLLCIGATKNVAFAAGYLSNQSAEDYDSSTRKTIGSLDYWTISGESSTWEAAPYSYYSSNWGKYYFRGVAQNIAEQTETELYQDQLGGRYFVSEENEYTYLECMVKTSANGGTANLRLTFLDENSEVLKVATSENINSTNWKKVTLLAKVPQNTDVVRASLISKKTTNTTNSPEFEACFDDVTLYRGENYTSDPGNVLGVTFNERIIKWDDNPVYDHYEIVICDEDDTIKSVVETTPKIRTSYSGYEYNTEKEKGIYSLDVSDITLEDGDYFRINAIFTSQENSEVMMSLKINPCYEVLKSEDLTNKDFSKYLAVYVMKNGEITGGNFNIPVILDEEGGKISNGTFNSTVENNRRNDTWRNFWELCL